jgi:hypothetical protein
LIKDAIESGNTANGAEIAAMKFNELERCLPRARQPPAKLGVRLVFHATSSPYRDAFSKVCIGPVDAASLMALALRTVNILRRHSQNCVITV